MFGAVCSPLRPKTTVVPQAQAGHVLPVGQHVVERSRIAKATSLTYRSIEPLLLAVGFKGTLKLEDTNEAPLDCDP